MILAGDELVTFLVEHLAVHAFWQCLERQEGKVERPTLELLDHARVGFLSLRRMQSRGPKRGGLMVREQLMNEQRMDGTRVRQRLAQTRWPNGIVRASVAAI